MRSRQDIPRYRVHCVGRSDRLNHDRRIRRIGGVNPDGARWQISEEAAVAGIEAERWCFFVSRAGHAVELAVAVSKYGHKYLKAADDPLHPESLLALPECR